MRENKPSNMFSIAEQKAQLENNGIFENEEFYIWPQGGANFWVNFIGKKKRKGTFTSVQNYR